MSENLPQVMEQVNLLPSTFAEAQKYAEMMAKSDLVPKQFVGKPGNCLIALQLSRRIGVDPLMMMQGMYVVHGQPGLYGKFVIAVANARGPFTGPIEFEYSGEKMQRKCRAYATMRGTGKVCESVVTMEMADKEQWTKNPKWLSMPDQMLAYRSAAFLVRLYCPEVLIGMQTVEELRDVKIVAGTVSEEEEEPVQLPSSFATPAPRESSAPPVKEAAKDAAKETIVPKDGEGSASKGISPEGMAGWKKNIENAELQGAPALVKMWKEDAPTLKRLATAEQWEQIETWKDEAKKRLMDQAGASNVA